MIIIKTIRILRLAGGELHSFGSVSCRLSLSQEQHDTL